jgi:hypothetical protein
MTCRDDQFSLAGETFTRTWAGDNSGRYEWTSEDGRLVCFRDGRAYSATLDGYPSTKTWPTLTGAMMASIQSRTKYDIRRAAA